MRASYLHCERIICFVWAGLFSFQFWLCCVINRRALHTWKGKIAAFIWTSKNMQICFIKELKNIRQQFVFPLSFSLSFPRIILAQFREGFYLMPHRMRYTCHYNQKKNLLVAVHTKRMAWAEKRATFHIKISEQITPIKNHWWAQANKMLQQNKISRKKNLNK